MVNRIHELKVFSSTFEDNPIAKTEGLDFIIEFQGYDDNNFLYYTTIRFVNAIGYKFELSLFNIIKESFDCVIEITESEWKNELENNNREKYNFWKPRHFALYLDEVGLYQVLANDVVVEEKCILKN